MRNGMCVCTYTISWHNHAIYSTHDPYYLPCFVHCNDFLTHLPNLYSFLQIPEFNIQPAMLSAALSLLKNQRTMNRGWFFRNHKIAESNPSDLYICNRYSLAVHPEQQTHLGSYDPTGKPLPRWIPRGSRIDSDTMRPKWLTYCRWRSCSSPQGERIQRSARARWIFRLSIGYSASSTKTQWR